MLKFKNLKEKDIKLVQKYARYLKGRLCDYSAGCMLMWKGFFKYEYAIFDNMLILKVGDKNAPTFFPPMGEGNLEGALDEIENYVSNKELPLKFSFLPFELADYLKNRYKNYEVKVFYNRDYSDYLYNYESIETFTGKKYSGQRNHINSFKRLYPNYIYRKATIKDEKKLIDFLSVYKKQHKYMKGLEKKEFNNSVNLVKNLNAYNFVSGYLEVDGKIVAMSIGEYFNDYLIIHVEKGLYEYKGVYPTMFNEFVKHSKKEGVKYVNREDDSGDLGLRTSKTQYGPICMVDKYTVQVKSPLKVEKIPTLKGDRIILTKITKKDTLDYYKLNTKVKNNKMWGYNYKKYNKNPSIDYFYKLQKRDFKNKFNMCFAIKDKKSKNFLGEVILHNFSYKNTVEVGIRLFEKEQGKGYAYEVIELIKKYVESLGLILTAKCYLKNDKSKKLFEKSNFKIVKQDEKYYYFELLCKSNPILP